mmetsp:Transcript_39512/g.91344  ORF Transcript_39512/g.91344 Transcript_39512/m.91344 type:complete len:220 (+) Transcript_39512:102-761(+)
MALRAVCSRLIQIDQHWLFRQAGSELKGWYCGRIYCYERQSWQLRSLVNKHGRFFLAPIIVDTGACSYNTPIFSTRCLELAAPDPANFFRPFFQKDMIQFPTPLGDDFDIGKEKWKGKDRVYEPYAQFNMVGKELAEIILECNALARTLSGLKARNNDPNFVQSVYEDAALAMATDFACVGATVEGIRREVDSMMLDPLTEWNEHSLPVPSHLLKQDPD